MATISTSWNTVNTWDPTGQIMSNTDVRGTLTYTDRYEGSTRIVTVTRVDFTVTTWDGPAAGYYYSYAHYCTSCCGEHSIVNSLTGRKLVAFTPPTYYNYSRTWYPNGTVNYGEAVSREYRIASKGRVTIEVGRENFGSCGPRIFNVTFDNPAEPPTLKVTCSASATSGTTGSFSAGGSNGNCPPGAAETAWALHRGSDNTGTVVDMGTVSSKTFSGLTPNQQYFIDVVRISPCGRAEGNCTFTTLTPNSLSDGQAPAWNRICARLFVTYGGGTYKPTTQIYYRKKGSSAWIKGPTSNTTTVDNFCIEDLEETTCYQVYAATTTTAGTYNGNTIEICTPKKCVEASITSLDVVVDEKTYETSAVACLDYTMHKTPAKVWVEYRVVGGYSDVWVKSEVIEYDGEEAPHSDKACVKLHDLFPNLVTYEYRWVGEAEDCYIEGNIAEFITPMVPEPDPAKFCEALTYLVDLLCASVHRLYHGNKTIFANDYSRGLCDPYNLEPTNLTLWSRFLRWAYAVKCLTCNMTDLGMKFGDEGQYFVGEAGWVSMLEEVLDEMDVDSWKLVTSEAIIKYIRQKIHEVWHYHMDIDYFVTSLDDAPEDAETVINLADNKAYKKEDGEWVLLPDDMQPDDFAVYHMNKESADVMPSGVTVKADSAWYYFEGSWQPLDYQGEDIHKILDELEESIAGGILFEEGTDQIKVYVVDKDFDYSTMPCERSVFYVTEDMDEYSPTYHTISFEAGTSDSLATSTTPQPQKVANNTLAQEPLPPEYPTYDFVRWLDKDTGAPFDWSAKVTKDYVLVAEWEKSGYVVKFDANGGSPTPPDQTVPVGGLVTQPTGVTRTGYTLSGWEKV